MLKHMILQVVNRITYHKTQHAFLCKFTALLTRNRELINPRIAIHYDKSFVD